jgi:Zn-dependent metalloprotease
LRLIRPLACLALLGAGLTAVTATGSAGAKPDDGGGDRPGLLKQLRADATGSVMVTGEDATKRLGFIRVGRNGDLLSDSNANPAAKADAFVDDYAPLLGAPADELVRESVRHDRYGSTVTYTQRYKGVPVFGSTVLAHFDEAGDLTSVNGDGVPNLDLSVDPAFGKRAAAHRAVQTVRADPPEAADGSAADTSGIRAASTRLFVYREGLIRGETGDSDLVWQVEVTNRKNIRDMVFISATTGKAVNRYSMIHDALERILIEAGGRTDPSTFEEIWREGDPFPGALNTDQQNEVLGTGESYWFFQNVFGRDSYDGAGHSMTTVNNDGRINCPNANWNGVTTNYCNGVTSDDVVAHEWGHAYTEFTHGLIYQWQPGALNESYSDIWGETVDLINGRMDEDEGDITAKRADGACSTHSPAQPLLTINSPADIAKDCATGGAAFGPQLDATGVTGDVVLGLDADEDGDGDPNPFDLEGSIYDGCSPFTNPGELAGNIVMVNRGLCGFEVKARNIDAAGGTAAIIANRDPLPITMSGDAEPDPSISSVSIGRDDRTLIADAIEVDGATVNVTMKDAGGVREDSFRWLMGEDSTAFGGAIRDMWTPTCYGDPGKVTDAEYFCSTDDGGGVHSNSGVPNHGYALLVDGGDYNGITVPSIGLTKAAAIYFRAMTEYQTPTTKFPDHADALEASCTDLIGQPINELSTDPNDSSVSSEVIAASDCVAVAAMAEAVELRTDPVQCNFQPLLDPDTPVLCASGKPSTFYRESFSDRLNGWTRAASAVFDPAGLINWESSNALPGGRTGKAAFAPGPDEGNCSGGAGDISGVSRITSPLIRTPDRSGVLAMSFEHYVATETGFDGGNLKISLNNGPFEQVPAEAFMFNEYNTTITSAQAGNTNPLAGQPGFSGTDGGEVHGSWGQSQIDLSMIGANPGDRLRLRFDFGRDGCGGLDGWYVDDIRISTCKATSGVAAAADGRHEQ